MASNVLQAALDLLYPRRCSHCEGDVPSGSDALCWECRADIRPIVFPFCSVCGNPVEGRISHDYVCYLCREPPRHFDRARSAARFEGVLQHLIHHFKYDQALWLESELVDVIEGCFEAQYADLPLDAVTCVPLFPMRERQRGYNQAELLGRGLAARIQKPFNASALRRIRATETQTHLTAPQRADNVRGAFEPGSRRRIEGMRLLLVDDVMTTGATLDECSRALKLNGAASVHVITVGRGTRM